MRRTPEKNRKRNTPLSTGYFNRLEAREFYQKDSFRFFEENIVESSGSRLRGCGLDTVDLAGLPASLSTSKAHCAHSGQGIFPKPNAYANRKKHMIFGVIILIIPDCGW